MPGSKIFFASDFHLGAQSYVASRQREDHIVRWLESIRQEAAEIYFMGDVFDFWFEYRRVVPRGFVRFLGKVAELTDAGIKVTFFKGNHDMWMFDYLPRELNATIISNELIIERNGKRFFLHHGDGLGPGDTAYKVLKKIFRSPICQWLFARLHPNFAFWIAQSWSSDSRSRHGITQPFVSEEQELLVHYCREILEKDQFDYMIFGHRHLPLDIPIKNSRYINLGEWFTYNTYAVYDGENVELRRFGG